MTRKPTVTKKEENGKKQAVSSEEDDDEEVEDLPNQNKNSVTKKSNQRPSVSAEAYGNFNKKGNFKARIIPKSEEQKRRKTIQSLYVSGFGRKRVRNRDQCHGGEEIHV